MSAIFSFLKDKPMLLMALLIMSATAIPIASVNASPNEVWVDDDWVDSNPGDAVDGHTFGTDAFATIQEGINAVAEGGTVYVAAGIYNEHVIINKTLTLRGAQANVDPTVEGARTDPSLESIIIGTGGGYDGAAIVIELPEATEGFEVVINGFTIKNPEGDYGVILPSSPEEPPYKDAIVEYNIITECRYGIESWYGQAAGDLIRKNLITNNYYGIESYYWYKTIALQIVENRFTGNEVGIYMCDKETQVERNTFTGNKYGIYVYYSDGSEAHYNNIYGNTEYGIYNEGAPAINAILNWWGDPSGPHNPTLNPGGLGDKVSDNVDFDPWLTAPITVASSKTGTNEWLEFPESRVDVYVDGSATVYVATYESNPGAGFMGDIGNYIDVYVPDVSGLTELEIRKYYTDGEIEALGLDERGLKLYWWNGTDWVLCSDTGVNTVENYIWARIRADTTPSLSDLTGTPFGAASIWPVGGAILPVNLVELIAPYLLMLIVVAGIAGMILKKRAPL